MKVSRSLEAILAADDGSADAHNGRALTLLMLGRDEEAEAHLRAADVARIAIAPRSRRGWRRPCGVYRSDNAGEDWIDIGDGKLPSRFGFPVAVHPTDPNTVYVALEESDEFRMSVDGQFSVWRSRDKGESWERLTKGLPEKAHLVVLREAMATDTFEDAGIYVGTHTGQLFYSRDSGDSWDLLADFLPPIQSVKVGVT